MVKFISIYQHEREKGCGFSLSESYCVFSLVYLHFGYPVQPIKTPYLPVLSTSFLPQRGHISPYILFCICWICCCLVLTSTLLQAHNFSMIIRSSSLEKTGSLADMLFISSPSKQRRLHIVKFSPFIGKTFDISARFSKTTKEKILSSEIPRDFERFLQWFAFCLTGL